MKSPQLFKYPVSINPSNKRFFYNDPMQLNSYVASMAMDINLQTRTENMLEVTISETDWNNLMEVWEFCGSEMDNPAVAQAWRDFVMLVRLTKQR